MEIDPRGPRFSAVITTIVLAVVLITGSAWLLAAQVAVFAVGALAGLRYAPYGLVYRRLVRPRLGPPAHTEAEAPPRFAQAMGMVIAGVGLICLAAGATGRPGLHRAGAGRGVPQRSLRSLPRLPRISVHPAESKGPAVRLGRAGEGGTPTMSRSDVLVDADWAESHIGDPGVVIVEVDEDTSAYDKGHIPTAIKIDWKKDLQDPVRRDFVDKTGFEALLSERGISNDDTVLLYGGNNNWFAAYAYWYFKLYGHDKVLLLDGGRKKWELDSRELTTDVPERSRTSYTATEQNASLRALRDEVVAAIGKRNLVDVRSPDEFTGRLLAPAHLPQEQAQRAGHIPTARNVPWSKAANEDGTFRADDELSSLYADDAGLDFSRDTIAYCRIGERSAHTWFVLHELLDLPNVKNYDGSWTEYGSLVGVPIELGEAR